MTDNVTPRAEIRHGVEKLPHPVFAAIWLALSVAMLALVYVYPDVAWIIAWFSVVLLVEGIAVKAKSGGKRDTMSQVISWAQAKLSKHKTWYEGWNLVVVLYALHIGWLAGTLIMAAWWDRAGWGALALAAPVCVGLTKWLTEHWIDPTVHG